MGLPVRARWLLAAALIALGACSGPAPTPPAAAPSTAAAAPDPGPQFAAHFLEAYFKANPYFAVQAGRHEFDGQMPDLSAAGIAAQVALLKRLRAEAQAFDAATLEHRTSVWNASSCYTAIDSDLYWLEQARMPFRSPVWYIEQLDPDVYLNRDYAPLAQRLQGYLGYARAIPKIAAAVRANLRRPCRRASSSAASMASVALRASIARTSARCSRPSRIRPRSSSSRRPTPPPPRRWRA